MAYTIPHERNPLDRIPHQAQPRPFQLLGTANEALHIHKRHRQQRPIFLEPADHALLALRREQEPLVADLGKRSDGTLDLFLCDELELVASGGVVGLGDDVDDVEDVDAALRGEVFAADEGGADDDEVPAVLGIVFGGCERHDFDAEDGFGGFEVVSGAHVSGKNGKCSGDVQRD